MDYCLSVELHSYLLIFPVKFLFGEEKLRVQGFQQAGDGQISATYLIMWCQLL